VYLENWLKLVQGKRNNGTLGKGGATLRDGIIQQLFYYYQLGTQISCLFTQITLN